MKKYLVIGREIPSKNDDDWHYISAKQVAELYRVNLCECIIVDGDAEEKLRGIVNRNGLITLKPNYDGDYNLDKAIQEHKKRCKNE